MLRSGVRADSHTGRRLLAALRTLPRDELLEAPTADLLRLAQLVVDRAERGSVGVCARIHLNRDFVSVLVYFPAERFGPETRRRVAAAINRHWPGDIIGRDDRLVELDLARMQFLIAIRPGTQPASPDRSVVEAEVARVTRRWSDDLHDLLVVRHGEDVGERLLATYRDTMPEAYKEDVTAAQAVADLTILDSLPIEDGLAFRLCKPEDGDDEADRRLKVFRTGQAITLARTLPIFSQMGIEVLERDRLTERHDVWIYDFGLRLPNEVEFDETRSAMRPGSSTLCTGNRRAWRQRALRRGVFQSRRRRGKAAHQQDRRLLEKTNFARFSRRFVMRLAIWILLAVLGAALACEEADARCRARGERPRLFHRARGCG